MRLMRFLVLVALGISLRSPRVALAAEEDAALRRAEAAFRGTIGNANNSYYVLTALNAGYRVSRLVTVGVFLESTLFAGTSSDGACQFEAKCGVGWTRLGPRLELHPFPSSPVSPWAAAGFGYGTFYGHRGGMFTALVGLVELGIDVYPVREFGVGPVIAYEPTTSTPEDANILSFGLRFVGRI